MDQLQRALNEAAVRLTGKAANQIAHDDPALDLVLNDLQESFVRKLSDADLGEPYHGPRANRLCRFLTP